MTESKMKIISIKSDETGLDILNRPELQELEWLARVKVWPSTYDGRLLTPIINEELHLTIKQLNRVKQAYDNLMKELIKAKIENEEATSNELSQMATFSAQRETRHFDKELARMLSDVAEERKKALEEPRKKEKRSFLKRLVSGK